MRDHESAHVDDRTEHELYILPFIRSVMAGVASVMCGYNKVNGTYTCEHPHLLNDILKGELGFKGYVMSDWGATHSSGSANAGLDVDMPGNDPFFGSGLIDAITNGTVPESRLDDMVKRMLAAWYLLGQDSSEFPSFTAERFADFDVQADHAKIVRQVGAASIVLLKNKDGALPLKSPKRIVAIGNVHFRLVSSAIDNGLCL